MRRARLRSVGGSVLLTLAGAFAVAGTLPRVALSGTLPACLTESSGTAWLGLHLSLLGQDAACPQGMFAPGAHYAEIARFSIMLSLSALTAGVLLLAGALGFGIWARGALRAAKTWIRHRLGLQPVPLTVATRRRPPLAVTAARWRSAVWADSQQLRGPPVAALA